MKVDSVEVEAVKTAVNCNEAEILRELLAHDLALAGGGFAEPIFA